MVIEILLGEMGDLQMTAYPRSITEMFQIDLPIIQAPMLGIVTPAMILGVAKAGGMGSLPLSNLCPGDARNIVSKIRQATGKPLNVNFLCHEQEERDPLAEHRWAESLKPYYAELGLAYEPSQFEVSLPSFGKADCALLEELGPDVVSFHFGLPRKDLLDRVRKTGAKIVSSATTVEEARWLEQAGCDAIIAQGIEAGGHRGAFLRPNPMDAQIGTMALVPQIVDAVNVPVIAAGGIGDPRGVAAAFALGASAVQVGTAFLLCEEANVPLWYREALADAQPEQTLISNVFTGRPARVLETRLVRELGPIASIVPAFPFAWPAIAPLRAATEPHGCTDFTPLWCGQAVRLSRRLRAAELTEWLMTQIYQRA